MAKSLMPFIDELRAGGADTLAKVADGLNARGLRSARGGKWWPATVRRVERNAAQRSA